MILFSPPLILNLVLIVFFYGCQVALALRLDGLIGFSTICLNLSFGNFKLMLVSITLCSYMCMHFIFCGLVVLQHHTQGLKSGCWQPSWFSPRTQIKLKKCSRTAGHPKVLPCNCPSPSCPVPTETVGMPCSMKEPVSQVRSYCSFIRMLWYWQDMLGHTRTQISQL